MDLSETLLQIEVIQNRSRQTSSETARFAKELSLEQERSNQLERQRKILESQIKVFLRIYNC